MTAPTDAEPAVNDGAERTPAAPGWRPAGDRRSRRLISGTTGVALLAVGALVAGLAIGWVLHARLAPQPIPTIAAGTVVVPPFPAAVAPTSRVLTIPDVRGLSQAGEWLELLMINETTIARRTEPPGSPETPLLERMESWADDRATIRRSCGNGL
jgi:hypothetical protein